MISPNGINGQISLEQRTSNFERMGKAMKFVRYERTGKMCSTEVAAIECTAIDSAGGQHMKEVLPATPAKVPTDRR